MSAEPEGYAECYPGLQEMNDAIDDSDDEVDYTKMDLGNKKGPIGKFHQLLLNKLQLYYLNLFCLQVAGISTPKNSTRTT